MEEIKYKLFHGTTREVAIKILRDNKFKPGEDLDNEDFLGKGVYFFKEKEHAVLWNLKKAKDNGKRNLNYNEYILEYAVLKADLTVMRKNLLDLNYPKDILKYNKIIKKVEEKFINDEEYINAKHKERAIINYLYKHCYMDGIYVIRKFERQKTKTTNLNVGDYIQRDVLCIKKEELIKNIEMEPDINKQAYYDIKNIYI